MLKSNRVKLRVGRSRWSLSKLRRGIVIAPTILVLSSVSCSPQLINIQTSYKAIAAMSYSPGNVNELLGLNNLSSPLITGGNPTAFSISPNLPSGLSLDATLGEISGVPSWEFPSAEYTITASNPQNAVTSKITVNAHDFGTGIDGALAVKTVNTVVNTTATYMTANTAATSTVLPVASIAGFSSEGGDLVLVIQMQDYTKNGILNWEFGRTAAASGSSINLVNPLQNSYHSSYATFNTANAQATQVLRIPQFTTVTVTSPGTITAYPWNPSTGTGGIIAFFSTSGTTVGAAASISTKGLGFTGGLGVNGATGASHQGYQGESWGGIGIQSTSANGGGGGGGLENLNVVAGSPGGSGGYAVAGS